MALIAVLAAHSLFADAATTEARVASRLLDRTFACSVGDPPTGGYPDPIPAAPRHLRLITAPEVRASRPSQAGFIGMYDKEGLQTREKLHITRGLEGVVNVGNQRVRYPAILRLDQKTCRPITDTPVPLSRRGTDYRPGRKVEHAATAGLIASSVECRVPARIVLRLRVILRRQAFLIVRGGEYVLTMTSTNRNLLRVEVAVRTFPALKPIAYAQIARNGTTALYASSSCVRT